MCPPLLLTKARIRVAQCQQRHRVCASSFQGTWAPHRAPFLDNTSSLLLKYEEIYAGLCSKIVVISVGIFNDITSINNKI